MIIAVRRSQEVLITILALYKKKIISFLWSKLRLFNRISVNIYFFKFKLKKRF